MIRKPQHAETLLAEPLRACRVLSATVLMLPAVQLDDQHPFDAAEVDDVRTDRMLAAKSNAQLMPAQTRPEATRGVSLFAAQSACLVAREGRRTHGMKIRTRKRRGKQTSAASSLDPHPTLPQDMGEGSEGQNAGGPFCKWEGQDGARLQNRRRIFVGAVCERPSCRRRPPGAAHRAARGVAFFIDSASRRITFSLR